MPSTSEPSVLVTGASTGIGECCALRLDALGFRVFAGVRKTEDAERLRSLASQRLLPVTLDVTDPKSIESACHAMKSNLDGSGLSGLVNNAGIAVGGPLEYIPLQRLRHQLEVNVIGQIAVTQACLPLLRKEKGRVVMMSSVSGRKSLPFAGPYAASKFALEALSDALRMELRAWGIGVAIIEPGSIKTPIWEKSTAVDEMVKDFPAKAMELYHQAYHKVRNLSLESGARGIAPDYVADAVVHALTARKPKNRYLVGRDARLRRLFEWLPDHVWDTLILKRIGL